MEYFIEDSKENLKINLGAVCLFTLWISVLIFIYFLLFLDYFNILILKVIF
jgi:hypothetical protein